MNFEYSEDQVELKAQARRFLQDAWTPGHTRRLLEDGDLIPGLNFAKKAADLGWLGVTIPEHLGGIGLGTVELCALAEEMGRALVPGPITSTAYGFTEALLITGSEFTQATYLPQVAAGELHGCLAFFEGAAWPLQSSITARVENGRLSGCKWPVTDAGLAQIAVVLAKDDAGPGLFLVNLDGFAERKLIKSLDQSRPIYQVEFNAAPAERLGAAGNGANLADQILQAQAVYLVFEQLGGAARCLEMSVEHGKNRRAFGRLVGSFQAIKHRLAEMYVKNELARSSAYLAAWALSTKSTELMPSLAAARIAASDAFEYATRETLQVHGGIAITWETEPHLYLRRSRQLAALAGPTDYWAERLAVHLDQSDKLARKSAG